MTFRHKMKGVKLADSITWDPHKMSGSILQCAIFATNHVSQWLVVGGS